jgi:hypothetical protein
VRENVCGQIDWHTDRQRHMRQMHTQTHTHTSSMIASLPMRTSSLLVSTSREGTRYFSMQASRMLIRSLGEGEGRRKGEGDRGAR